MKLSGRSAEQIALVEAYAKAQGMWRNPGDEPVFTSSLALDMSTVEASLAGPKRPQDRVALPNVPQAFKAATELDIGGTRPIPTAKPLRWTGSSTNCATARW